MLPGEGKSYGACRSQRRSQWDRAGKALNGSGGMQGWMFQLVGQSQFPATFAGKSHTCVVDIISEGLNYRYLLTVDGKPYEAFSVRQRILNKSWVFHANGEEHSVVLGMVRRAGPGPSAHATLASCRKRFFEHLGGRRRTSGGGAEPWLKNERRGAEISADPGLPNTSANSPTTARRLRLMWRACHATS